LTSTVVTLNLYADDDFIARTLSDRVVRKPHQVLHSHDAAAEQNSVAGEA
jgi:hypothetical protein